MCQHEMTKIIKTEKNVWALAERFSSTSKDDHKTGLTDEGQILPCTTVRIPFHGSCKRFF